MKKHVDAVRARINGKAFDTVLDARAWFHDQLTWLGEMAEPFERSIEESASRVDDARRFFECLDRCAELLGLDVGASITRGVPNAIKALLHAREVLQAQVREAEEQALRERQAHAETRRRLHKFEAAVFAWCRAQDPVPPVRRLLRNLAELGHHDGGPQGSEDSSPWPEDAATSPESLPLPWSLASKDTRSPHLRLNRALEAMARLERASGSVDVAKRANERVLRHIIGAVREALILIDKTEVK